MQGAISTFTSSLTFHRIRLPRSWKQVADMGVLSANGDKIYPYINFDRIADFKEVADTLQM